MDPLSAVALLAYYYFNNSTSSQQRETRIHQYEMVSEETVETLSENAITVKNKLLLLQNQIEHFMTLSQNVLSDFELYYQRFVDEHDNKVNSQLLPSFLTRVVCALKEIDELINSSCDLDMSDTDIQQLSNTELLEEEVRIQEQIKKNNHVLYVTKDTYERIRNENYVDLNLRESLSFMEKRYNEYEIEKPTLLHHVV